MRNNSGFRGTHNCFAVNASWLKSCQMKSFMPVGFLCQCWLAQVQAQAQYKQEKPPADLCSLHSRTLAFPEKRSELTCRSVVDLHLYVAWFLELSRVCAQPCLKGSCRSRRLSRCYTLAASENQYRFRVHLLVQRCELHRLADTLLVCPFRCYNRIPTTCDTTVSVTIYTTNVTEVSRSLYFALD